MKRIYLSPTGEVRLPTPEEKSHYGVALTVLGPDWKGDAEAAYAEMWKRGWVRAVDYGDKVYAERYLLGSPVRLAELLPCQRAWIEGLALSGKSLFWNDKLFSLTSEGNRGQAAALVRRLVEI
jgi:hypothetical protein